MLQTFIGLKMIDFFDEEIQSGLFHNQQEIPSYLNRICLRIANYKKINFCLSSLFMTKNKREFQMSEDVWPSEHI